MLVNPYIQGIKQIITELEDLKKDAFYGNEKASFQVAIDKLDNLRVSLEIIQVKEETKEVPAWQNKAPTIKKSLG